MIRIDKLSDVEKQEAEKVMAVIESGESPIIPFDGKTGKLFLIKKGSPQEIQRRNQEAASKAHNQKGIKIIFDEYKGFLVASA